MDHLPITYLFKKYRSSVQDSVEMQPKSPEFVFTVLSWKISKSNEGIRICAEI